MAAAVRAACDASLCSWRSCCRPRRWPVLACAVWSPDLMLLVGDLRRHGRRAGAGRASSASPPGWRSTCFLQTPLGLSALAFSLVGFTVGLVGQAMVRASRWIPMVTAAAASALGEVLFAVAGVGRLDQPGLVEPVRSRPGGDRGRRCARPWRAARPACCWASSWAMRARTCAETVDTRACGCRCSASSSCRCSRCCSARLWYLQVLAAPEFGAGRRDATASDSCQRRRPAAASSTAMDGCSSTTASSTSSP